MIYHMGDIYTHNYDISRGPYKASKTGLFSDFLDSLEFRLALLVSKSGEDVLYAER